MKSVLGWCSSANFETPRLIQRTGQGLSKRRVLQEAIYYKLVFFTQYQAKQCSLFMKLGPALFTKGDHEEWIRRAVHRVPETFSWNDFEKRAGQSRGIVPQEAKLL